MGKFAEIVGEGCEDLEALTAQPIHEIHPDDQMFHTDADGDQLRVTYFVRDNCDGSPIAAGFHFATTPDGVVLDLEAAERQAEWLQMFIEQAREAKLS